MATFPTAKDVELIKHVKKRHAIYDKTAMFYSNREFVSGQWAEIGAELECDAALCKSRWQYLRDYFVKKRREPAKMNKRPWHLYPAMSFLLPYIIAREGSSAIKDSLLDDDFVSIIEEPGDENIEYYQNDEDDECSVESSSVMNSTLPMSTNKYNPPTTSVLYKGEKRNKRKTSSDNSEEDVNVSPPKFATKYTPSENDDELFFMSLLPAIGKLDYIERLEFRYEVQNLAIKYFKSYMQRQNNITQLRMSTHCTDQHQSESNCTPDDVDYETKDFHRDANK